MQIACILINYRNPLDTLACLKSIEEAGMRRFKVFLINNYSRDGSGDVLKEFLQKTGASFSYQDPGQNLGFTGGVNLGIRAALEENFTHILLLNNDTLVAKNFTAEVLKSVEAFPSDVLAGKVLDLVTGQPSFNIGRINPLICHVTEIFDMDFKGTIDFVSGCLMIIPASVLKQTGVFDDRYFMYREDFDFCLRLKKQNIRIRYCPSIVILHKVSASTSQTRTPMEYYRIRNQTHIVLHRARFRQKVLYLGFLICMLPYKAIRRPHLLRQTFLGIRDGLLGRLGKRHNDSI